jgi:excisionase family DNA binding protein
VTEQALRPKLWSTEQVAQLLGIHWQTVRKLIRDGELQATRIGDRVLVRDEEVDRFIDAHTPTPDADNTEAT